jgi:hypothetical protein
MQNFVHGLTRHLFHIGKTYHNRKHSFLVRTEGKLRKFKSFGKQTEQWTKRSLSGARQRPAGLIIGPVGLPLGSAELRFVVRVDGSVLVPNFLILVAKNSVGSSRISPTLIFCYLAYKAWWRQKRIQEYMENN